jgi:hypothetical protein
LIEKEAEKFKALLSIPNEIAGNIHEGFEPLLVSGEVVDTHFKKCLDLVLDYSDSSDLAFIEQAKDALTFFIGEWIDELQDGFINGMQDVVIFFRENFKTLIQVGAGPEMGMMIGTFGTDTIMNQITKAFARYKERKA